MLVEMDPGGPYSLADLDRGGGGCPYLLADLDRGGPYLLADLDRGVQIRKDTGNILLA